MKKDETLESNNDNESLQEEITNVTGEKIEGTEENNSFTIIYE